MKVPPILYIIAGCNGAGKTTASKSLLPQLMGCRQYVNADEIARGLSPFDPESVSFLAGRIMLKRINELLDQKKTFAIETTLATRSYANLVKRAKQQGYKIGLIFFWLPSSEQAVIRVKRRVEEGGHGVPQKIIKRRYRLGLENLFNIFIPLVDQWIIIDNSRGKNSIMASNKEIVNQNIYNMIKDSYYHG